MRKKFLISVGVSAVLVTGAVAYASNEGIVPSFKSYKEVKGSTKLDGESQKKFDEIRLKANKDKKKDEFKNVDDIQGVVPESKLKKAHYKLKELMTYEEAYNQGYTDQLIYEIDPDRMVYVIQAKSEEDLEFDGRPIKKPEITTLYDAETGEKISYLWVAEN